MPLLENQIIAHRGASYLCPENTLIAVNTAWESGAKAVEIDVHVSADGEIAVIHDKDTNRTGNHKKIVKQTLWDSLKTIDVGSKKSIKFKDEKIPTLAQVLKTVPPDGKLIVEVKCGLEILKPLTKLLNQTDLKYHQIEIICFNLEVLTTIKNKLPQYKALWLLDLDYYLPHWMLFMSPKKIIKKVKKHQLDGINVWAGKMVKPAFVNYFKKSNLLFYVWTVNEVSVAKKMMFAKVDAITTDRPAWLRKQLRK